MKILIVTTSLASRNQADILSGLLLEKRLAACIQSEEIISQYHWDGKLHQDKEIRLTLKSSPKLQKQIIAAIRKNHPYDCPQILCWQAEAEPDYAKWVEAETIQASRP